ncbi:unnamed protein product [Effrenium voratum]|nr:unnamed protein product [Effrenium voratum]
MRSFAENLAKRHRFLEDPLPKLNISRPDSSVPDWRPRRVGKLYQRLRSSIAELLLDLAHQICASQDHLPLQAWRGAPFACGCFPCSSWLRQGFRWASAS